MTVIVHDPTPIGRADFAKPISAAKEAVRVEELAGRLAGPEGMNQVGATLHCRCVLPDHEDRTPSFVVYPDTDSWWCFGCSRGGDVVDLAALAWNIERPSEAAGYLLLEFGHEVPKKPEGWHRRQERQAPVRERLEAQRIEHVRLLLFRLVCLPWLRRLPEPVREEAAQNAWREALPLARMLYEQRRGA